MKTLELPYLAPIKEERGKKKGKAQSEISISSSSESASAEERDQVTNEDLPSHSGSNRMPITSLGMSRKSGGSSRLGGAGYR